MAKADVHIKEGINIYMYIDLKEGYLKRGYYSMLDIHLKVT